jgi:2,3-bisphosphoglycerate-dependent phosphoglycerate mutase
VWNAADVFTGWVDVPLSVRGHQEAAQAGQFLRERCLLPDVVHTSLLRRAIATADITLGAAGRSWLPVRRSWRLNERHYGALQGRSKQHVLEEFGDQQFMLWRRSYETRPPPLPDDDAWSQASDARYARLPPGVMPRSECLPDVLDRLLPYWHDRVVPDLRGGGLVLVVAHGTALRALVMHLDGMTPSAIGKVHIPTASPLVYRLDRGCRPLDDAWFGHEPAPRE